MSNTSFYDQVSSVVAKGEGFLTMLADMGVSPDKHKTLSRTFNVKDTEKMVGKTIKTIAKLYEDDAPLADFYRPKKHPVTNRTAGFTLEQINGMRDHYGTRVSRTDDEKLMVLAVQSFKGGVGKSVTTVHLAQYLALAGYRILIMDCDPQASTTSSFGYIPDLAFEKKDTIIPFLDGESETLDYCVRKTYFDGIDLIPSCLPLYDAEFGLYNSAITASDNEERLSYWTEFREGIDSVSSQYDIVLLDSPPALGMISINILIAADGVIVPTSPSLYDFASTTQYFKMAKKISQQMPDKSFDFIKVLATRVDASKPTVAEFAIAMQREFSTHMYKNIFKTAGIIPAAASYFKTMYELTPKDREKHQLRVDKRQLNMLEDVFEEILADVHIAWGRRTTFLGDI